MKIKQMRVAVSAFSLGVLMAARTVCAAGPLGTPVQAGTIKGAFGLTDATFAPYLKTVLERRAGWIAKSEAAKPKLVKRDLAPVRLVRMERDAGAFQGWRAVEAAKGDACLDRRLHAGETMVLDFGEHLVGRLSFRLGERGRPMDAPCRLKFTFGEVPAEIAVPPDPAKTGLCASWYPEEVFTFDFAPMDYALPRRYAFRYVKVEVVACPHDVPVFERVTATAESSADERQLVPWTPPNETAAKIDRVALNTLRDCMQTMLEDGPKRDRRLWLGDLRLEALADYQTYRNFDVVKRSMYLLAGTAKDSGVVGTDAYEQPFPKQGNCHILDYTALYPTVVLEYLEASGDRATAEDLWPLCVKQLDHVLETVDADGLLHTTLPWWYFIDHANLARQVPEQGALIFGLKGMWRLAQALGREKEVAYIPGMVEKMSTAARAKLWDAQRGLFVAEDNRTPSYLGQAWMVLAGVPSPEDARRCLETVLADPKADRPRTPYGYHYLVESLYVAGLRTRADALLLSYWGQMVEKGADTFWEAFVPGDDFASPYGCHQINSACHAWSCAPSYFLRNPKYHALSK